MVQWKRIFLEPIEKKHERCFEDCIIKMSYWVNLVHEIQEECELKWLRTHWVQRELEVKVNQEEVGIEGVSLFNMI